MGAKVHKTAKKAICGSAATAADWRENRHDWEKRGEAQAGVWVYRWVLTSKPLELPTSAVQALWYGTGRTGQSLGTRDPLGDNEPWSLPLQRRNLPSLFVSSFSAQSMQTRLSCPLALRPFLLASSRFQENTHSGTQIRRGTRAKLFSAAFFSFSSTGLAISLTAARPPTPLAQWLTLRGCYPIACG